MEAQHDWGPELVGLTMADEIDDIELGERVSSELCIELFVTAYALGDRGKQMYLVLAERLYRKLKEHNDHSSQF